MQAQEQQIVIGFSKFNFLWQFSILNAESVASLPLVDFKFFSSCNLSEQAFIPSYEWRKNEKKTQSQMNQCGDRRQVIVRHATATVEWERANGENSQRNSQSQMKKH